MKMVVVSGKFDPIDAGHMALLKGASELGNYVIVGLSSDDFVKRSKGFVYQSYDERERVLRGIKYVNGVNFFDDIDETPVTDFETAAAANGENFKTFFHGMLREGIYIAPSAFETWFLCDSLSYQDLDKTIDAAGIVARTLK